MHIFWKIKSLLYFTEKIYTTYKCYYTSGHILDDIEKIIKQF